MWSRARGCDVFKFLRHSVDGEQLMRLQSENSVQNTRIKQRFVSFCCFYLYKCTYTQSFIMDAVIKILTQNRCIQYILKNTMMVFWINKVKVKEPFILKTFSLKTISSSRLHGIFFFPIYANILHDILSYWSTVNGGQSKHSQLPHCRIVPSADNLNSGRVAGTKISACYWRLSLLITDTNRGTC